MKFNVNFNSSTGLPAVVMLAPGAMGTVTDDHSMSFALACRKLEEQGADVVGLNCWRGPDTIMDLMGKIRKECKVS